VGVRITTYELGVYLTLCSWHFETSQTSDVVMNLAAVDAPGYVYPYSTGYCLGGIVS